MDHSSGLVFRRPQAASHRRAVVYCCSAVLIKKIGPKRYRIRIGRWRFIYTMDGRVVWLIYLRAPTRGHVSVMTPDSRSWESLFSAWATRPSMRSTGSTRSISTGKTCKALVVSILVPQERLGVDDLPASANLG